MCSLTHQKCLSSIADSVCSCLWCAKCLHCYLSHLRFFLPFNSLTGREKEPNQDPCTISVTCPSLAFQFDTMFDKLPYPLKPLILVCNAGLTIGLNTHKIHKEQKFFTNVKDYYMSLISHASLGSLDYKHTVSRLCFEEGRVSYMMIPIF